MTRHIPMIHTSVLALLATLALLALPAHAQFGGFQRTEFPSPVSSPDHMALGDLDGDGDLDVAITTGSKVRIVPNNGDGTLGSTSFTSSSVAGGYIILDDFDGVNGLDMCIVDRNRSHMTVMLNDGAGSFVEMTPVSIGFNPFDGISADLDGDSDKDLAIVSENAGEFTVALNDGAGGFAALAPVAVDAVNPEDIAAADLDGDGDLDLGVMERTNHLVHLYTNDGAGNFTDNGVSYSFVGGARWTLTSSDINHDGLVDFLAMGSGMVTMLNNGDGTLSPQTVFNGLGGWAMSIFAPDLDGDGNLDVVVDDVNSKVFRWAFGNGDGTFADADSAGTVHFDTWAAVGDMDGNGTPDVVVATRSPGFLEVFINQTAISAPGPFALSIPADNAPDLALPEHITGWQLLQQPKFTWETPTGFGVTYDLSISTTGGDPVEVYTATDIPDPSHPVPSGILVPGIEYAWEVTAINPIGSSVAPAFTFTMAPGPNPCPPDFNGDGSVDTLDFLAFLNAWNAGCP